MLYLKKLEKEEQMRPKVSRRKEINRLRAKINETENKQTKKTIENINATKSWFFEKVNKIGNPLARLTKEKRERTPINKIRDERGEIMTDTLKIQRIIQEYYENVFNTKFNNLEEMD